MMKQSGYLLIISLLAIITSSICSESLNVFIVSQKLSQIKIVRNFVIHVDYGRAEYVDSNDLSIKYDVGGHCQVTVLKNDPYSSQIGSISPTTFPCDFQNHSVLYQHYGSLRKMTDVVKLQVRLDTKDKTLVAPLMLRILIVFDKPLDILKKVDNLIVNELGGLSEPIGSNILSVQFNEDKQVCNVGFIPKDNGPPFYGDIVNMTDGGGGLDIPAHDKLMYMPCGSFLSGVLRYAHRRSIKSSKKDYIPLVLELTDKKSARVEKREFVQLPVRIRRAAENERPTINYNTASYSLQVDQLMLTAVTSSVMQADDRETAPDLIVFNITIPPAKNDGYLVHTDDPTRPVTTFYQRDVRELKIAFKPPERLSTSQRLQQIWMEARDSEGASSASFYVIIVIKPMNYYAPQVVKNTGLAMYEGQSRTLSKDKLTIRDPDNEDDVTVTVIGGLFHGRLEKNGREVNDFTVTDINNEIIRYVHDDSDSYGDGIILKISDGKNEINALFTVNIIPIDDQPPRLVYNTGLNVDEGASVKINQFDLSARDVDSDDTKISFEIIDQPTYGYLFRRPSNYVVSSTTLNEDAEKKINRFSQVDIILGDIYYKHSGKEKFYDYFTFRLSDGSNPPNLSGLKTFIIDIQQIDDLYPNKYPGCPLNMNVLEGEKKEFTKQVLRYTDQDSFDDELRFIITQKPYFIKPPSNANAGKITFANNDKEITHFTQKQVNHFKIVYHPPKSEIGVKKRYVKFMYNVSDTQGNFIGPHQFLIELSPVNNKVPIVLSNTIIVRERQRKVISSANLQSFDNDNLQTDLLYLLKRQPKHGDLLLDGRKMQVGASFTPEHITNRLLEYFHDGSETKKDEIKLILTDTAHMVQVLLPVEILPSDDQAPVLTVFKKSLNVNENGVFQLNGDVMQASDEDSEDEKLTFFITSPLKYGNLMKYGAAIAGFKLIDLDKGLITYKHTSGEIGRNTKHDILHLNLTDLSNDIVIGGNIYSGIQLEFNIIPIDSEPPIISGNLKLQVAEGATIPVLKKAIEVTDIDTGLKHVSCNITKVPIYGYLETTSTDIGSEKSRAGVPLSHFTAHDLKQGFIRYVQSLHERVEPTSDAFKLRCSDGFNVASEVTINVAITPTNDEAPIIFVQPNIICVEDDLILFDLTKINPYDADKPTDELTITVTKKPINGELLLQTSTELKQAVTFTRSSLIQNDLSTLLYQHKGTETRKDSFELRASDGVHDVTKVVEINIISMDDETPRLIVNTGLRLERGETKVITSYNLKAVDLDSYDDSLMYIVMMRPINGKLQKVISPTMTVDIGKGGNFTQFDLNMRRIRYTHMDQMSGDRDVIRIDVTDGFNRLINQMFTIMIALVDNILPTIVNHGVTVNENSRIILTTELLSASDLNTPDEKLQFTITKTPLRGYLQQLDNPYVPITKFSQLDLAANKISYIHTSKDEVKLDNFEFEVTDGRNKVFRTFRLHINDVNNKKPTLHVNTIHALQGQETVVTPFELNAVDNDTKSREIKYKIHSFPKYGKLLLDGNKRIVVFSQYDLQMNTIFYKHDGSNSKRDHFTVTITDGKHNDFYIAPNLQDSTRKPVGIQVTIATVDKKAPVIVINKGASSLRMRKTHAMFKFTANNLKASDDDSEDAWITFSLKQQPLHGRLVRLNEKTQSLSKFTQKDVNDKNIAYILNNNSEASSDVFLFDVYDSKKNVLSDQPFHLKWAWVSVDKTIIHANESDSNVRIVLNRKGFLGETSFVTYELTDGTAEQGKHFKVTKRRQVQFNPGQTAVTFDITLVDNLIYEKQKSFVVLLKKGFNTLITSRDNVTVKIVDPDDEPSVFMLKQKMRTKESIGLLKIPIGRSGDISDVIKVICFTESDTAKGTLSSFVTSYTDYITRHEDDRSDVVTFYGNETVKYCGVKIIDDSIYEEEESFQVNLSPLYGGRVIKKYSKTIVTIDEDFSDEPIFSFGQSTYKVDESDEYVTINVIRKGSDISMTSYVLFATKQQVPVSAKVRSDYQPLVTTLMFKPGIFEMKVHVNIMDDEGRVRMEGKEEFQVLLRAPRNGRLSSSVSHATVIIDDTESDKPRFYFSEENVSVNENIGNASISIEREGDLRFDSYIRCYTSQMTAKIDEDFLERRNINESFIHFGKKEKKKKCQVSIIDDHIYEAEKELKVILGMTINGVVIETRNETIIKIVDNDKPIIEFSKKRFYIREPTSTEKERQVKISIRRLGDASHKSVVMVHTVDGSASSSTHYEAVAKRVEFGVNETEVILNVKIYHDPVRSLRTAFSLQLLSDDDLNVTLRLKKTVVYIEESDHRTSVTFPLKPMVVSLMDYDDVTLAREKPIQGYPVVCITACNPKHARYDETKKICSEELINDEMTSYKWQVAPPSYSDGISNEFKDVNMKVFFTSTNKITLDSIYFNAGSRVRCIAQPFSEYGNTGVESYSDDIVIDAAVGLCMPKRISDIGAETFSMQVAYTGVKDGSHKNLVKIKVLIPHFDGLLPVISTKRLSNFELALSPDVSRSAQHTCSNMLNPNEISTLYGFGDNEGRNNSHVINSQPHQFDSEMRGNNTLRFYENLNLDTCLWSFESYFTMTELVETCGGKIITDGLVKDAVQSHLTVDVPLFVSYIYHSSNDEDGWIDFNHESSIRLTAVYNTGMLWKDGVGLPEKTQLKGNLYPASIIVRKLDRKLQVNFRTKARFRGLFIIQDRDGNRKSEVTLAERPSLPFILKLIRTDPTYSEPEQLWQMESKYAVGDYTGSYIFNMLPCTVDEDEEFSLPPDCTPQDRVAFHLNISIQQTSEPVEATFTLNTRFILLNNRDQWTSNFLKTSQVTDVYFKQDEKIYGRVMIDSAQSLGNAYHIVIEKVFLCSGIDGYLPMFDPDKKNYGCIADSANLIYRFKVLDRLNPETSKKEFSNVDFNAKLAVDDNDASHLVNEAGSDGFNLDSNPLFKVSAGRSWFVHVIYTLRSKHGKNRGLGKRSIDQHLLSSIGNSRQKRDVLKENNLRDVRSINDGNKGTNLQMISLDRVNIERKREQNKVVNNNKGQNGGANNNHIYVSVIVVLLIAIFAGFLVAFVLYKRSQKVPPAGNNEGTEI